VWALSAHPLALFAVDFGDPVRYFRSKLIHLVVVVFATTFLSFALITILSGKGNKNQTARAIAGVGANEQQLAFVIKEYDLDKPIPVQYFKWVSKVATGDFGNSYSFNVSVESLIADRLPVSFQLMIYSQILALIIAIPMAAFAAYRANGPADRAASTLAFGLLSTPNYVLAIVLVLFALKVGWFPAISKYHSPFTSPGKHFNAVFLPTVSLAAGQVAIYMRLLRADMVATFQQDFVTMARAKGMSTRYLVWRHAFRPSLFSTVTAAATNVGALIGGSVIIEQIFAYPGMGDLLVQGIGRRDLLTVQACVIIFSMVYVLSNFLVDISYSIIDPRVRDARKLA
jgi:peptide/nickel transport system permease protein